MTKPLLETLNEFLQFLYEQKQVHFDEYEAWQTPCLPEVLAEFPFFKEKPDYRWTDRQKYHSQLCAQWKEKFHFSFF